mmetsp:Transcript_123273/g.275329  ORF Transcript_123273/g.275329 Transcript_123273/m.275329 type:complete len:329 (-) Transcript_123273:93-1079(-)
MAIEARPTDSVRLSLSSTSKLTGKIDLERFGEVCRIDVIESSSSEEEARLLEVSFFDVRAAVAAKAAFGDSCSFAPQHGQRHLRLLGSAGLEVAELSGVSNISQTEEGDFVVEFFDSRSAAKAANFAYAQLMPNEGSTQSTPSPPPTKVTRPRKVHDLMMSQLRWEDLASNREWRTALQLRGLPSAMCETRAIKALLESNDLLDLVESVQATPSRGKFGHVIVNAKAVTGVGKIAKFFHGKRFGGLLSIPVSVSFATVQGNGTKTDLKKRQKVKAPETDDIGSTFEWTRGTTELPWHVETCGSLSTMCDSAASDVPSDEAWPLTPPGL